MPINPQIVVPQVQGIQLENPLSFARNALAMQEAQSTVAANQLKLQRANALKNVLAAQPGVTRSAEQISNQLLSMGYPEEAKMVMDAEAARVGAETKRYEANLKGAEILGREAFAFTRDPSLLNKQEISAWGQTAVQRGLMSPEALQRFDQLPDDPQTLFAAMMRLARQGLGVAEQKAEFKDIGGQFMGYDPLAASEVGARIDQTPLPADVEAQEARLRAAGRSITTFLTPSESSYSKGAGEKAIDRDFKLYEAAASAPEILGKVNQTLQLIDQGAPITGAAAELQLNFDRLKSTVTGRKDKKVEDTEILDALLGSDVFASLQGLGLQSKNLDTPAEREYLRKVIAGSINLNENTLRRMAVIRGNVQNRLIDRFNSRVDSGELDRFFRETGYPKRKIEKPEMPIPASAVNRLKQNPSAQAKIQFDEVFGDGAASRVLSAGK